MCSCCGLKGHMLQSCPTHPGNSRTLGDCEKVTLGLLSTLQKDNCLKILATIHYGSGSHELLAFVDSGAAANFIDQALVFCLSVKTHALECPVLLISVNNQTLSQYKLLWATIRFMLQLDLCTERFLVLSLILYPFLSTKDFPCFRVIF